MGEERDRAGAPDVGPRLRAEDSLRGHGREGGEKGEEKGEGEGRGWARYDPERLVVYRLARAHSRAVRDLLAGANTHGFAELVDDLRRSAKSITANIKEGYGEHRPAKKANYYYTAKASATEAWGHTDSLVDFKLVTKDQIGEIRDIQNQIIALLVTMIKTQESRAAGGAPRKRRRG